MVAKLRRAEELEHRGRYFMLTLGVLVFAGACFGFGMIGNFKIEEPAMWAIMFSVFFPMFIISGTVGMFLAARTLRNWSGDPIRVLLLKVIDEKTRGSEAPPEQTKL